MSDARILRQLNLPDETLRKARELLSIAKEKTKPGSGHELPKGLNSSVLLHICAFLACEIVGSGSYSERQGGAAACVSSTDFRKGVRTVRAALAATSLPTQLPKRAPSKTAATPGSKRTPSKTPSASSSSAPSPSAPTQNTPETLCRRYEMRKQCPRQGFDFDIFRDDLERVERSLKTQGWNEKLWDPQYRGVVSCAVFSWTCEALKIQTRKVLPVELGIDGKIYANVLTSISTIRKELRKELSSSKIVDEPMEEDLLPEEPPIHHTPVTSTPSKSSSLKRKEPPAESDGDLQNSPTKRLKEYQPSRLSQNAPMTPSARRTNAAAFNSAAASMSPEKRLVLNAGAPQDDVQVTNGDPGSSQAIVTPKRSRTTTPSKSSVKRQATVSPTKSPTALQRVSARTLASFDIMDARERKGGAVRYRPVFPDRDFYAKGMEGENGDDDQELEMWLQRARASMIEA